MPNYRNEINIPQEVIHNESGLNYQQNINNNNVNNNSPDNVNNREVINGSHLNSNRPSTKPKKNPNWWRRRSLLERFLTIVSIFLMVAIVALIIGLVSVIFTYKHRKEPKHPYEIVESIHRTENICLTPECIHTASEVLDAIDSSIDPCDDFYRFACGNFLKKTNIPEDKVAVDTFSVIDDKVQEQLKSLVTEENKENVPQPFKLANSLYKACMNKTLIEKRGLEPIVAISNELGGWPVIKGDDWNESNWDWQETVKKFRNLGFSMDYILDFSIDVDLKNSTKRIINLDQSAIGLSREYLITGLSDEIVAGYYDYMIDLAVIFGAERSRAQNELKESLEFEISLANISLPIEKRRNSSALYNPMSIADLQEKYPYVQWLKYINALLPKKLKVNSTEIVIVCVPKFFEDLGPLLKKTPKRVIANYMMWRIHAFSSFFLTEELRKRQLQYATIIYGVQEREPRWKECVAVTSGSVEDEDIYDGLGIAVGALYVRKYFQENAKSIAMEMVNGIQNVFEQILLDVTWMDDQTKKSALNKLKKITTHIGYPDEIMDDNKLIEYYENLEINPDLYLESILKMNVFGTNYAFNKLRKPVNKTDWLRHARPADVNAYYSPIENSIQFPAGILQGKFFNADRPKYMNYGSIGYVIGHEITHGFDDQGRQFDLNGNLVDWWAVDTKNQYLKKVKCIIHQYGNYTDDLTKLNLNGINTQGENIADNGGIKESYIAYNNWASKHGPEKLLPGLHYTPQQMFWLSAAQTECSVDRLETMKVQIITGVHSPAEFRVFGPMSNMKEFSKDFNCPEGSKMNPIEKCEVW